jgi:hypothetical protein
MDRWLDQIESYLMKTGCDVKREGQQLRIPLGDGPSCLILTAERDLIYQLETDLEEVRMMIAGDTTEDLSEDELCRVAREELRPFIRRHQSQLLRADFQEKIVTDQAMYAVTFTKPLKEANPEQTIEAVQWCLKNLTPSA